MCAHYSSIRPSMQNAASGTSNLHTPQSIFQHVMNQPHSAAQEGTSWSNMPQIPPMTMPWRLPSMQQPDLVRFTGEKPQGQMGHIPHHKRKLDVPDIVSSRPAKQFITEEKIAASFQGLYITQNSYEQNPQLAQNLNNETDQVIDIDIDSFDSNQTSSGQPRLVFSDALKNIQQEPFLPPALLTKLERPSMALVLWEPPSRHLRVLPSRDTPTPIPRLYNDNNGAVNNNNNSRNNNNSNNNNEPVTNLNESMDTENLQPMDL